jgi:hypothetical protein
MCMDPQIEWHGTHGLERIKGHKRLKEGAGSGDLWSSQAGQ